MLPVLKRIWLILLVLSAATMGFAANTVHERLLEQRAFGTFPLVDKTFQVADPLLPSHPAVPHAYDAFRDVYSPQWYNRYVLSESILQVNRMHDSFLASVLPSRVSVARALVYPDYVLVPVRVQRADQRVVLMDVVYREDDLGRWRIVSIGLD